jgi:hypothetical protein
MAHKNWSKEQYKFEFYRFILKFDFFINKNNSLTNLNSSLFFLFLIKKNFPNIETNILFLKNIQFFFSFKDRNFFNFYNNNNFK